MRNAALKVRSTVSAHVPFLANHKTHLPIATASGIYGSMALGVYSHGLYALLAAAYGLEFWMESRKHHIDAE